MKKTQTTKMSSQFTHLDQALVELKQAFENNKYPSFEARKSLLLDLKKRLIANEQKLYKALSKDYGYRSEYDSLFADFLPTILSIKYILKNLKKWMKPSKRHSGWVMYPSSAKVFYQPLGVVGVIVPWNFPLYLSFSPILTALAAGNKVMVKMSEYTPQTNKALTEVLAGLEEHVRIFEGEAKESAYFSSLAFDHLLFTGSTAVGKHVARAAANNLTPTTLELGGKSPVIIEKSCKLERAVEAIVMGKSINSGQICVAPDYILLPPDMVEDFIALYRQKFLAYFQDKEAYQFSHIINKSHQNRLQKYLDDAIAKGAKIHEIKNFAESESTVMSPRILTEVDDSMLIMQEEIFGSLLPLICYENLDQAINYVNTHPRPLALYIMSEDQSLVERVQTQTHSGGVAINDTIVHVGVEDAPFGGIGDSGLGQYHGVEGFHTFSKAKTVFKTPSWMPRNEFLMKNREVAYKLFRKLLIK